MDFYEKTVFGKGYSYIAGIDEAGRGPLAGPVVATAVILPKEFNFQGIKDSKKLSEGQREKLYKMIFSQALAVGIGKVDNRVIDRLNILRASLLAMKKAVINLNPLADYLLIDGINLIDIPIPQMAIKKGDEISYSIAAASIVAKVTRDRLMAHYHKKFPQYNFLRHKGYATEEHLEAIKKYGPSPVHRMSFRGVATKLTIDD